MHLLDAKSPGICGSSERIPAGQVTVPRRARYDLARHCERRLEAEPISPEPTSAPRPDLAGPLHTDRSPFYDAGSEAADQEPADWHLPWCFPLCIMTKRSTSKTLGLTPPPGECALSPNSLGGGHVHVRYGNALCAHDRGGMADAARPCRLLPPRRFVRMV